MPRAPSRISFVCESCQRLATVRQVRRWFGQCYRCQARSWTLLVQYTETEVNTSAAGVLSAFMFGLGWRTSKTHSSQTAVGGLSEEDARFLVETRSQVASRVIEYVRQREQEVLRGQGAKTCAHCDAIYMPAADKPWNHHGYCSKSCAAKDGQNAPKHLEASATTAIQYPRGRSVSVVCPKGHEFEVAVSYSGCNRSCTECGTKTPIP